MQGIKRASPYIMAGTGFCGIGVGLYYMFVERSYKKDLPDVDIPTIPPSVIDFFKRLFNWLEHHPGGGNPGTPGIPSAGSSDASVSASSFSSSSGSSGEHMLDHVPVELWALIAVGMTLLAIGYQCCVNQQKATPRPAGR